MQDFDNVAFFSILRESPNAWNVNNIHYLKVCTSLWHDLEESSRNQ